MSEEHERLSRTSTKAVHFLVKSDHGGLLEIACGTPVPATRVFYRPTTLIPSEVTCKRCYEIANPRPTMMGGGID